MILRRHGKPNRHLTSRSRRKVVKTAAASGSRLMKRRRRIERGENHQVPIENGLHTAGVAFRSLNLVRAKPNRHFTSRSRRKVVKTAATSTSRLMKRRRRIERGENHQVPIENGLHTAGVAFRSLTFVRRKPNRHFTSRSRRKVVKTAATSTSRLMK